MKVVAIEEHRISSRGTAGGLRDQTRRGAVRWIFGYLLIVLFGGSEFVAVLDRDQLVLANSPDQDLLLAGLRIEAPASVLVNERDREGPVLSPDVERD